VLHHKLQTFPQTRHPHSPAYETPKALTLSLSLARSRSPSLSPSLLSRRGKASPKELVVEACEAPLQGTNKGNKLMKCRQVACACMWSCGPANPFFGTPAHSTALPGTHCTAAACQFLSLGFCTSYTSRFYAQKVHHVQVQGAPGERRQRTPEGSGVAALEQG
jgi:hypothetical protein